jgi:N utilization substance protein B
VTTRREARRTALDILYQADITDADADVVLADWREAGRTVTPFAQELIDGVASHLPEIDPLLEEHSEGWTVARMATLDRTIMRIAVEAATELSSDESRRYVNGILGRIARELGRPETEQQTEAADQEAKELDAGGD